MTGANNTSNYIVLQDDIIERINQHVTSEIRVFGNPNIQSNYFLLNFGFKIDMKRVGKRFNPKTRCNGRTYQYFLPTYAFKPVKKIVQPETTTTTENPATEQTQLDMTAIEEGEKPKVVKQALWAEDDEPFEFTEETREKINQTLKKYVGSHNFHNFTNSLAPKDKKCQRIVNSFEVSFQLLYLRHILFLHSSTLAR